MKNLEGSTKEIIMPIEVSFKGVAETSQFLEFPWGILKVLVKDSTLIKVPGADTDTFECPSIFVKFNGNFGYSK